MCIRDRRRSAGGGHLQRPRGAHHRRGDPVLRFQQQWPGGCLLYTSDAADERSSGDLGGRRVIKKKKKQAITEDV